MYLTAITAFPANELRLTLMDADDTLANGQTVRVTLKNIGGKLVVTREFTEAEDENLLHRAAAELAAALRDSELMEYSFTLKNGEEIVAEATAMASDERGWSFSARLPKMAVLSKKVQAHAAPEQKQQQQQAA